MIVFRVNQAEDGGRQILLHRFRMFPVITETRGGE